jgi:hypothetical protein
MQPTTRLFIDAVAIHRELIPLLAGVPDHRKLIRDALGTPEADLVFLVDRFAESGHADMVDVEAAAMFAWLPADALPQPA